MWQFWSGYRVLIKLYMQYSVLISNCITPKKKPPSMIRDDIKRTNLYTERHWVYTHTHTHTHSFLTSRTRNHYHSNQTLVRNISNKKIACIGYFGQSFPMLHARKINIQGIHLVLIIKILLCSLYVNMYNYQIIIYP